MLAALLGFINIRFFRLPQSIGLTVMGAVASLLGVGIDRLNERPLSGKHQQGWNGGKWVVW